MVKKSASINLVKSNQQTNLGSQIINWALTVGRVLIILVEVIALSAFIYRFVLDNQLRDINSRIKQEQQILALQKEKEVSYRNLQDRLTVASSLINQGKDKTKVIKDIIGLAPQGINFNNISYTKTQVNIQLTTGSVIPLSTFINALRTYNKTDFISIDLIENRASSAVISVGLTVNIKGIGGQDANTGN